LKGSQLSTAAAVESAALAASVAAGAAAGNGGIGVLPLAAVGVSIEITTRSLKNRPYEKSNNEESCNTLRILAATLVELY
jgi:hypothetical protein